MQTEQLILQRLDTLSHQLDEVARRQRATDELFEELTPIAREALATAIARLDVLDQQGYFTFFAELARSIVDMLRDAGRAKPLGAFRAVRATRDEDVQKGLGIVIDLLRQVGHRVNAGHEDKALDQKAKLAELLGPRRPTRALPAPRPAPPTPAVPAEERAVDPGAWTRELGEAIAREQGISLDEQRWNLIDVARADFAATRASPNIQRLKSVAGVSTKDLYQLFPKAPARTIAKIAGLPKPAGCL